MDTETVATSIPQEATQSNEDDANNDVKLTYKEVNQGTVSVNGEMPEDAELNLVNLNSDDHFIFFYEMQK